MDTLTLFILRKSGNAWINALGFHMYLRHGYHAIEGLGIVRTFDIANISLPEKQRGEGRFHQLLSHIEKLLIAKPGSEEIIYVESILNPRFELSLQRQGFKYANQSRLPEIAPSMYRSIVR